MGTGVKEMYNHQRVERDILLSLFIVLCALLIIGSSANGATFLVTNTADTGDGSLAWAIGQAEANPGPDTVGFAIPTSDPNYNSSKKAWKIEILTPLPIMMDGGTFIDGSSQATNIGINNPNGLEIAIYGKNLGIDLEGFIVNSPNNKFYALSIGAFQGFTILFRGENAHDNIVTGCYLGLDASGMQGYHMKKSEGIRIDLGAHHNIVGGSSVSDRNVISGFYGRGLYIDAAHHNVIKGNYIGVKKSGIDPLGNGWKDFAESGNRRDAYEGVLLTNGSYSNVIGGPLPEERNIISANYRAGLRLESTGSDSNVVQGNYIGLGADGETALGNGEAGVWIARDPGEHELGQPGPAYNLIGGEVPGAGNVISGNLSSGIQMRQASHHNRLVGNYIGTNATATRLIPNSHNGVYFFGNKIEGFPIHNEVGPGNVIIASGIDVENDPWAAVRMDDEGTSYNWVHGNYLGSNPQKTLGSEYNSGVLLAYGASHNVIGPENVISGNKKYGVWVRHDSTLQNTITENSIFNNGDLGIITIEGGNRELLPPALLSANEAGASGSTYPLSIVELFADDEDEAQVYLGRVVSDSAGNFSWQGEVPKQLITATVTDIAGNTSMLSASRTVPVELSSFQAVLLANDNVRLTWRTESETNNLGFYIEREYSPGTYSSIGFVQGVGTSAQAHDYFFVDKTPLTGKATYRLRQVDSDGTATYSQLVSVTKNKAKDFSLFSAYPNPFNSSTVIKFDLPEATETSLWVINLRGEIVTTLVNQRFQAGSHTLFWDGRDRQGLETPSGCYFIQLATKSQSSVQKVLLLK